MELRRLWLNDFRNYCALDIELSQGCTLVVGANGQGKTNLVEAVTFLATLDSFRGATADTLVRVGADEAIVRGEVTNDGRRVLVETSLPRTGRVRARVNGRALTRARDLLGSLRVSVFSPDDLVLVKEGPAQRRRYLDDVLVALHPPNDQIRSDLERVLRQRNALLRQTGGRLSEEVAFTLDVWDERLADVGEHLAALREQLVRELEPAVVDAYRTLASSDVDIGLDYAPGWRASGLLDSLRRGRAEDVRRGLSLVGPHRDDLEIDLEGRPARTHASQGEQRCLALALRLAAHRLIGDRIGSPPVLVLDDVFSELDPRRSAALLAHLPDGQVLMTTAGVVPPGAHPDAMVTVEAGTVTRHE